MRAVIPAVFCVMLRVAADTTANTTGTLAPGENPSPTDRGNIGTIESVALMVLFLAILVALYKAKCAHLYIPLLGRRSMDRQSLNEADPLTTPAVIPSSAHPV